MPRKKLSAVAIPHPAARRLVRRSRPRSGPAGRPRRRTWSYRYHRRPLSARAARLFPAMSLAEAREAARRLSSAPTAACRRGPGAASALGRGADPRRSHRSLRGCADGKAAGSRRSTRRCGSLRRNLAPCLALPADRFPRPTSAPHATPWSARRHARRQPPPAASRAGAEMGRAGRPDPGELRPRRPQGARAEAHAPAHRLRDREDLAACGTSRSSAAAANFGRLVRFLLVTAQRLDEAACAAARAHPRRRLAAGRQQVEPAAQPRAAAARPGAGRAGRRARLVFAGPVGQDRRLLEAEDGARRGQRRQRVAAARSASDRGDPDAGPRRPQPHRPRRPQPRAAGRRRASTCKASWRRRRPRRLRSGRRRPRSRTRLFCGLRTDAFRQSGKPRRGKGFRA